MKSEKTSITRIIDSISIMKPKPSPYKLKRIGGKGDGAYLIPDDLDGIEACFSPGVNNYKNFEDELTDTYGIKCHMCDYSSDIADFKTPLREGSQTFKKMWLDIDSDINTISLEQWIEELSLKTDRDLLLQMDIEGAEYRNLLSCKNSILQRFRIIVLELHGLHIANNEAEFEKELGPLLRKLDINFICVHAHPNNCSRDFVLEKTGFNIPNVLELTFLRRDRFDQINVLEWHKTLIPHPLDINLNVIENPLLFLSESWCSNDSRALASKIKIVRSQLIYIAFRIKSQVKNLIKSFFQR